MTPGAVEALIASLREVAGRPAIWPMGGLLRRAADALTAAEQARKEAEQKWLDEMGLVSRIQSSIETRLSDAPTREAAIFDRIAVIKRESLSRYGSDSQIRKDWKAILAKAESDLAAAEQATRTLQAALEEIAKHEHCGAHEGYCQPLGQIAAAAMVATKRNPT